MCVLQSVEWHEQGHSRSVWLKANVVLNGWPRPPAHLSGVPAGEQPVPRVGGSLPASHGIPQAPKN
jgi:hypothetical protein